MDTRRMARKRARMFIEQKGICSSCGCQMVLCAPDGKRKETIRNMATFDHKYPLRHPLRETKCNNELRIFLICWQCNQDRNIIEDYLFNAFKYLYGAPQ